MSVIREAIESDIPAIAAVHIESWLQTYGDIFPSEFLASKTLEQRIAGWRDRYARSGCLLLVSETEGRVCGFLHVGPPFVQDEANDAVELYTIYILTPAKRSGLGRRMCERAFEWAVAHGFKRVVLWALAQNDPARAFYEAMGFELDGETDVMNAGGRELPKVRYSKRVGDVR